MMIVELTSGPDEVFNEIVEEFKNFNPFEEGSIMVRRGICYKDHTE